MQSGIAFWLAHSCKSDQSRHLNKAPIPFAKTANYDIAIWPWYGSLVLGDLYDAAEFLDVASYTHVVRWAKQIAARPGVKRGRRVNRTWGAEDEQLAERHSARDFE